MEILLIGNFRLPDRSASATYILGIQKIFSMLGHKAFIIDKRNDNSSYSGLDTKTIKLSSGKIGVFQDYFIYAFIKEEISIKYDLIMPYNLSSYQLYRIYRFCKKHQKAFIPITTEWYDWRDSKLIEKPIKALDVFLRMNVINKMAKYHIVCSKYLANYYNHSKTLYIPTIAESNTDSRKSYDSPKSKLKLIYIGNPSKRKENLSFFISSLRKSELLNNSIFHIYGIDYHQYIQMFNESLPDEIGSIIIFHGYRTQGTVIEALRSSDFSVIFREVNRVNLAGFPTKLGTSIANGIPVLTTDTGDICDFITSGKNGYLLPTNESELINTLNELSRSLIDGSIALTRDFNSKMFSPEQYLDQVSNFLSEVEADNRFLF